MFKRGGNNQVVYNLFRISVSSRARKERTQQFFRFQDIMTTVRLGCRDLPEPGTSPLLGLLLPDNDVLLDVGAARTAVGVSSAPPGATKCSTKNAPRARLNEQGYLYLQGLINREAVEIARAKMVACLQEKMGAEELLRDVEVNEGGRSGAAVIVVVVLVRGTRALSSWRK